MTEAAKAKAKIDHYLGLVHDRGELDEFDHVVRQRLTERQELLERLAYLRPDDTRPVAPMGWVHGDFHDLNLVWSAARPGRVTAVLDWDRLRLGPLADAVHRLWWERVCDFWQLTWHYGKVDASCDHLFISASALLAWWSEHRDSVSSAFTRA